MSSELLYTSAPQGLKAGSRGFTTVLCTAGMPPNLADKLESFSGYKHVYSPQDPLSDQNPVRFAYLRPNVGGRSVAVISRLAAYGVDYSGRSNKIAHHIVLEPNERPIGGPAWLMSQSSLWKTTWDGACKTVSAGPQIPSGDCAIGVCQRWSAVMGDAGWGGQLATWLRQSSKPIWLVYATEQRSQILQLIGESLALLPIEERWKHTFATYFSGLPGDVDCRIRGVVSGSDEARLAAARGHVIDLTKTSELAATSELIVAARTGEIIATTQPHYTGNELGIPIDSKKRSAEKMVTPLAEVEEGESHLTSEGSLLPETPDAPILRGESYDLAPPPMPNQWPRDRSVPSPPIRSHNMALPYQSSLPLLVVIAIGSGIMLAGIIGVYFAANMTSSFGGQGTDVVAAQVSENEKALSENSTEIKDIDEGNLVDSDSGSETKVVPPELPAEKPLTNNFKLTLKKEGIPDQVKELKAEMGKVAPFEIEIQENQTGDTGYEFDFDGSDKVGLSTDKNSKLKIKENKIIINNSYVCGKRQDELVRTEMSVAVEGQESIDIHINVSVKFERYVGAREINLNLDKSRDRELRMDLVSYYSDYSFKESDGFRFELCESNAAVLESKGKVGTIKDDGNGFVYIINKDINSSVRYPSKEVFDYVLYCYGRDSRGKIVIVVNDSESQLPVVPWDLVTTADGGYIILDKSKARSLIKETADYSIDFVCKSTEASRYGEYRASFEKTNNSASISKGQNSKWPLVGTVTISPMSNQDDRINFDDPKGEMRDMFECICLEPKYIVSVHINLIEKKIIELEEERKRLDDERKQLQDKKEPEGKINELDEKIKSNKNVANSLANDKLILEDKKKSIQGESLRKASLKSVQDFLGNDVNSAVEKFWEQYGVELKGLTCDDLKKEVSDKFEAAKAFVNDTRLTIKLAEKQNAEKKRSGKGVLEKNRKSGSSGASSRSPERKKLEEIP
jgi:hypothetical protein